MLPFVTDKRTRFVKAFDIIHPKLFASRDREENSKIYWSDQLSKRCTVDEIEFLELASLARLLIRRRIVENTVVSITEVSERSTRDSFILLGRFENLRQFDINFSVI